MAMGADGIGLFRTELLVSRPEHLLDEDRQVVAYSAAAIATEGRPIVFRTFDVGGDKPVAGFSIDGETNPFLGLRGVRLCFERLDVFTTQLRAIARVGRDHPNVEILIPMISGVEELERVIALLAEVDPDHRLKIGTMVEVPSASLLAHELAARCDFLSVGTNDLTAYILAADRTNTSLQGFYSELHPAVIRTLSSILVAGRETGTKVSVCGELAGDVRALPLLIGLGLRHFSAAAPMVPRLKHAIQSIDSQQAQELASQVLQSSKVQEVEDLVDEWIAAH
jgi:phosphoenolpyruvate-protein kinase (PTS system EI component)